MKSRISYFDKTIFKKNLTRFAPAWGLYTVCALMGLILLVNDGSKWMADNLMSAVNVLCVITPCYALICAQLLFGDLYNSRMCNALHALPLKRETWFVTNVISGFVFHLIPTAALTLLVTPILAVYSPEGSWVAGPLFLLGTNLQFACFFGLAVLCAFCVGSRFAMGLVYAILNFGAIIVSWLIDTIFVPMYYGIMINTEPFELFSPIVFMANAPFADTHRVYASEFADYNNLIGITLHPGEGTVYYFIVAAIGIVLLFAAMGLYRRRQLECAGDFLAIRVLEPVFLVIYSVIVGAVFHFCVNEIVGMETYIFLFLGLAVGWFTGKMLLERTPRVFRRKNMLQGGILLAVCALTIVGALMDPLGIESWTPKADKVESVTLSDGYYNYAVNEVTLDDPESIARVIALQESALEEHRQDYPNEYNFEMAYKEHIETTVEYVIGDMEHYSYFSITYKMNSGRIVRRYYRIWLGGEDGKYLKQVFSSPEAIFGCGDDQSAFLSANSRLSVRDTWEGNEIVIRSQADLIGLYQAILADCEEHTMAQSWTFHHLDDSLYWIYLEDGTDITIFSNCQNTLNWLREYGIDVEEVRERYGK